MLGGCLSPNSRPASLTFRPAGVFGGLGESMEKSHADFIGKRAGGKREAEVTVQCFPLMDILNALQVQLYLPTVYRLCCPLGFSYSGNFYCGHIVFATIIVALLVRLYPVAGGDISKHIISSI